MGAKMETEENKKAPVNLGVVFYCACGGRFKVPLVTVVGVGEIKRLWLQQHRRPACREVGRMEYDQIVNRQIHERRGRWVKPKFKEAQQDFSDQHRETRRKDE